MVDNVRHGFNRDLRLPPRKDRSENIRRVAEVAPASSLRNLPHCHHLLYFPYREGPADGREIIGGANFIEAFVDAPLQSVSAAIRKGLYAKACRPDPGVYGIPRPTRPLRRRVCAWRGASYSVAELVEQVHRPWGHGAASAPNQEKTKNDDHGHRPRALWHPRHVLTP